MSQGKNNLALIYGIQNEHEKQLALYLDRTTCSAPPFNRAQHFVNVATAELAINKRKEAEEHLQMVWDLLHTEIVGENEQGRATVLLGSWTTFHSAGQRERAEQAFRESVEVLGKDPGAATSSH